VHYQEDDAGRHGLDGGSRAQHLLVHEGKVEGDDRVGQPAAISKRLQVAAVQDFILVVQDLGIVAHRCSTLRLTAQQQQPLPVSPPLLLLPLPVSQQWQR
jgi:hypothetical protein